MNESNYKINKKDYIQFINNNKNLTNCEKKTILNYFDLKFNFYVNTISNIQIQKYFEEAVKDKNITEITRLQVLFMHFINYESSAKIIEKLYKNNKLSDNEIIDFIKNNTIHKTIHDKYQICEKWEYAIEILSHLYINKIKSKNNEISNIKYLDLCCGSGKKSKLFHKNLGIEKSNTYISDIQTWGPYQKNKSKMPFQFTFIENNKLDYENEQFDLVTCILSLHHVKELESFIKEIYRIIKKNGFLLLIDHCVYNDYDRLFINIQHMLYTYFYDKKIDYIENPEYIYCFNMHEWNYIMSKNKFFCKISKPLIFGNEYTQKFDNIFYAFYQKK